MAGLWPRRLRPRYLPLVAASVATLTAGVALSDSHPLVSGSAESVISGGQGLLRSSRAIYTFAANSFDYKYSLQWYDKASEDYFIMRSQVHLRAAKRILRLCETNRGFYIKAGQFVASLQHMPKEYVSTLSVLQDKARPCAFKTVERLITEQFGKSIFDMFKEFDEQPVAAASLAQVHHATLQNGQEVAVKVQYPRLQQQFTIDISTMAILSKALAWLFPDYQFQWVVPEFEKTLLKELDFEQEARNAERTARIFQKNDVVKVPQIFWDLTTKRVLTMQFMHGCKVDDVILLEKAGLDPHKVAQSLVEVFAEMIFCHGYVHGDPHPGNILIHQRSNKMGNQFDIVLLDHGLYRELDEGFRSDFCRLWMALILLDTLEMQRVGERLGAGKYYKYLPVIFTGRTLDSTSGLGRGMSVEERKRLREEVRMFTLGDISQFMEGLPWDFFTVLRTDGLLRSITSKLGAPPRIRLMANAKYAISGLSLQKRQDTGHEQQSWFGGIKAHLLYVNLRLRLGMLEAQFKLRDMYSSFVQFLGNVLGGLEGCFPWRQIPSLNLLH